jgi:hypothetical protein
MVNAPGSRNIPLRPTLVERLMQRWIEESGSGTGAHDKFGGFVNDMLERVLNKYQFIHKYMPNCVYVGMNDGTMLIKDVKKGRICEVMLRNERLYCKTCSATFCDHVIYALSIPEVAQLDSDHGGRKNRIEMARGTIIKTVLTSLIPIFGLAFLFVLEDCPTYLTV